MMEALQETKEAKSVIMFFGKLNMTSNLAMRVYQVFKDDSEKIVRENPYILAEEVKGNSFIADAAQGYIDCMSVCAPTSKFINIFLGVF